MNLGKGYVPEKNYVFCFDLMLYLPVNSYGHVRTVSSPNHTFTWASLTKWLTGTLCTYLLVTDNNPS